MSALFKSRLYGQNLKQTKNTMCPSRFYNLCFHKSSLLFFRCFIGLCFCSVWQLRWSVTHVAQKMARCNMTIARMVMMMIRIMMATMMIYCEKVELGWVKMFKMKLKELVSVTIVWLIYCHRPESQGLRVFTIFCFLRVASSFVLHRTSSKAAPSRSPAALCPVGGMFSFDISTL